jgi:hypothetical protein
LRYADKGARKINKKEIIDFFQVLNVIIDCDNFLWEKTKHISKKDGEYYSFYNYYDIQDLICKMFTKEHYADRRKKFCTPAYDTGALPLGWVDMGDAKTIELIGGFSGYTGDIMIDITLSKTLTAEDKYNLLKNLFKFENDLLKKHKKIGEK